MNQTRVLVVEDESITALDLRARLVKLGYDVPAIAAWGEEAIERAAELHPDLVLMDIRLAGEMDGIAAGDSIRARLGIPVVYLTAYSDDETLQRAKRSGPFGYLLKPFSEQELRTTIEVALYRHNAEMTIKADQDRLRRYARRLEILHQIDQAILAAGPPEAIADAALQRLRALIPCQRVSVARFDQAADQARLLAVLAEGDTGLAKGDLNLNETFSDLETVEPGSPFVIEDLRAIARPSPVQQRLLAEGIRSYVLVPLRVRGELIGSLNLGASQPAAFDQESLDIALEVANSLALAIHHADLHAQIERHAAELEAQNAELDAYAHTVAHDLRSPLVLIVGYADLLKDSPPQLEPEEVPRYADVIGRTGLRMEGIIRELLLLAEVRQRDVERMPLDMGRIVTDARDHLAYLTSQHPVELSLPESWPVALGYAPWVEQVWVNYLSNAVKHGGRPARIELGATVQPEEGMVRFWVRDNGPGIPPQDQPRLFAPFTQLSQVRAEGHGLGLSIVRRIVEKLGGQVGVESQGVPGRGSVFYFALPAATLIT